MKNMEKIINPEHYTRLKPEPIEVIEAWGLNFNLGSVISYIARNGHKDDAIQDLSKAIWYIEREIKCLYESKTEPKLEPKSGLKQKEFPAYMSIKDADDIVDMIAEYTLTWRDMEYITSSGVEVTLEHNADKLSILRINGESSVEALFKNLTVDIESLYLPEKALKEGQEYILILTATDEIKGEKTITFSTAIKIVAENRRGYRV